MESNGITSTCVTVDACAGITDSAECDNTQFCYYDPISSTCNGTPAVCENAIDYSCGAVVLDEPNLTCSMEFNGITSTCVTVDACAGITDSAECDNTQFCYYDPTSSTCNGAPAVC